MLRTVIPVRRASSSIVSSSVAWLTRERFYVRLWLIRGCDIALAGRLRRLARDLRGSGPPAGQAVDRAAEALDRALERLGDRDRALQRRQGGGDVGAAVGDVLRPVGHERRALHQDVPELEDPLPDLDHRLASRLD